MNKLIIKLQKVATGRIVLLLFIITMAVYLIILFYSIPAVISQSTREGRGDSAGLFRSCDVMIFDISIPIALGRRYFE
jgi:choline-glycine betaine transporter